MLQSKNKFNNKSEIKKYIYKHPELKKYFPEEKSKLYKTNWAKYADATPGSGYRHEEKLRIKRYSISSTILNAEDAYAGNFSAVVLFHSPTHFLIEYLIFKVMEPVDRKFTIIDGRRNMKDWVEELDDEKINKRVYSKYRKDDEVKY